MPTLAFFCGTRYLDVFFETHAAVLVASRSFFFGFFFFLFDSNQYSFASNVFAKLSWTWNIKRSQTVVTLFFGNRSFFLDLVGKLSRGHRRGGLAKVFWIKHTMKYRTAPIKLWSTFYLSYTYCRIYLLATVWIFRWTLFSVDYMCDKYKCTFCIGFQNSNSKNFCQGDDSRKIKLTDSETRLWD